ncbi:error-prone DNA polymerase [Parasphingorhabdus cellanae]|uniref:Error-prone DNA polymerase n=1 Tax=Parasphingorhabdus cellanae TaxID=2806553 RepID=A0ABX7T712_9SPHN|nr:error-prone DNA polymerase [Parasphingorhabdus cellanae]QTD57394.1 error-prone DNA polymerase [Parasphingorhabdus cellanae]
MTDFAELVAATHYSFLRGASSPADMVLHAMNLGMSGLGIADRNSVAGVVRAHVALRQVREDAAEEGVELPPFHLIVGARLCFVDETPDIIAYPVNRKGWGRLTRLLSTGNLRTEKGACHLMLSDLLDFHEDLQFIAMAGEDELKLLQPLIDVAHDRLWAGVTMPRDGADRRYLAKLQKEAARLDLPLLATNAPLFATAEQRPLSDILTCISEKTTIGEAGRLLAKNAEAHLKPPQEMGRLFADCPQAIEETQHFLSGIHFSLDELSYHYPDEPVPEGWTPQGWLEHLAREAAAKAYPGGVPSKLSGKLNEELELIGKLEYAPYFLTVHDIVRYARSNDILCQGRGSAANSVVCYLLDITAVDPMKHDLLFSRFISQERKEPPDIDVDFEHERREEIIQYVYDRYGRSRAAIAATVVHYRSRSAIREVGKALGLSEDITSRLSSTVWGSWSTKDPDKRFGETGLDPDNAEIARLGALVQQILEFPRHLSQHVGGFVLTQDRLDETVPIHNAAMDGRTFIEWDKNDIDALGLMKVDVLALGMLTCIRKSFDMMRTYGLGNYELATVPAEDPVTYDMLCEGDSVGVFQVESRAQMNMLPRLRPREFYDLVIQVAIVRPGPIEGDMVHPYLRRRSGVEKTEYPSPAPPHDPDELRGVLGRTFGVPLFQEQAMKLAIVAADFSPTDANKLRRAMATFRNVGTIHHFQAKMIDGMAARGYEREFAERCYKQIQGFGSYGFPESHAQSFAILVYISSWIKCHHPAVFAAALLNSQPMGFYAPAQIIRDACEHDVEVRSIDINHSQWDNILEASDPFSPSGERVGERGASTMARSLNSPLPASPLKGRGDLALRLGLRQIDGFRETWAERMIACRPFASIEALAHEAKLPQRAMQLLADADACRSIGLDRRQALWEVRRAPNGTLPLFAAADARELAVEDDAQLPGMTKREHVITDYQTTRLSLKGHPMEFLRGAFDRQKVLRCADVDHAKNGSFADVAGIILIRQRPGKGNAIFVTLEDETGVANILIWARLFERYRRPIMSARLMKVRGEVQKSKEGVIHIIASHVEDCTDSLDKIATAKQDIKSEDIQTEFPANRGHPRNVRILPRSRDFH